MHQLKGKVAHKENLSWINIIMKIFLLVLQLFSALKNHDHLLQVSLVIYLFSPAMTHYFTSLKGVLYMKPQRAIYQFSSYTILLISQFQFHQSSHEHICYFALAISGLIGWPFKYILLVLLVTAILLVSCTT